MKKLLLLTGGIGMVSLYAQTLSPQVISSSGTVFSNSTAQLEFTIGEVATQTLSTGGTTVTQGFHQPEIHFTSIEDPASDFTFSLYPNPTEQFVTIESGKAELFQIQVYDVAGKIILTSPVFEQKTTIDLLTLAAGSYILRVVSKDGKYLHSYTVIKKSTY